jgi:proteasome activator subunit 4
VFDVVKPIIEELLASKDKDKNKQRGAAEFIAGIIGGSKHWGVEAQNIVWDWFEPHMETVLRDNLKTDTINIWISFLEVGSSSMSLARY